MSQIGELFKLSMLQEGIQALKAGDREKARGLLTQVVTADAENEQAWLWLSRAVTPREDKQICLENVLALNPHNTFAQNELAQLKKMHSDEGGNDRDAFRMRQVPKLEFQHTSNFDDIWTHAESLDLCAYCAHEVAFDAIRCPNCRQSLTFTLFRYEKTTPNFHVFWVLLLGLAQLFMIQTIVDLMMRASATEIIIHGFMVPTFLILTAFVYKRQFWAFVGAMIALFSAAGILLTSNIIATTLAEVIAPSTINTPLAGLTEGLAQWVTLLLRTLQSGAIAIALFYGFFLVSPDFMRDRVRLLARLNKGISSAGQAFATGIRFKKRKMWAAAVLHWRKALALDPTRLNYYLELASGFEQLGFFERSLDVLKSAEKMIITPEARTRVESVRNQVITKMDQVNNTDR